MENLVIKIIKHICTGELSVLGSGSVNIITEATGADLGMLKGGADTVQVRRKQFCFGTGTPEGSA